MQRLVFLIPLFMAGCSNPPSSLAPLGVDSAVVEDDRLVGDWRLTSARPKREGKRLLSFGSLDNVFVTVASRAPSRYAISIRHKDRAIPFAGTLCSINDELFLDLQRPPLEDASLAGTTLRPHFLVKCVFTDEGVRLTGCDGARFQAKLQELGLPFVEVDAQVVFTGDSTQLRELVREHSATLFPVGAGDVILRRPTAKDADKQAAPGSEQAPPSES